MFRSRQSFIVSTLVLAIFAGCGKPVDPAVLAIRQKLILTATPQDSTSISKIRAALSKDAAEDSVDVVVRGKIHAGDSPPWETDQAAFILTDATGHDGDEDHDPHTCPYCSRNINDYMAKVRFLDDSGVIPIDSRELLDLQEKQLVLVQGVATIDDDDNLLTIDAKGLFPVATSNWTRWIPLGILLAVTAMLSVRWLRQRSKTDSIVDEIAA